MRSARIRTAYLEWELPGDGMALSRGGAGTPQPGAVHTAFSTSRAAAASGEEKGVWEGKVLLVVLTEVANCLGRPCLHIL